jgi:cellulase/cellobiase CelA1
VGAASTAGESATGVALGSTTTGGAIGWGGDSAVAAAGAHEANRTANRLRVERRRFFKSNPF